MSTALTTRLLFRYSSPDGCRWDTDFELSLSPEEFERQRREFRNHSESADVQPVLSGLRLKTTPSVSDTLKAFFGKGTTSRASTVEEVDSALGNFREWKYFFATLIIELDDTLRIRVVDRASTNHGGVTSDEIEALSRMRQAIEDNVYTDIIIGSPGSMPIV
jgi:hypothetical protein